MIHPDVIRRDLGLFADVATPIDVVTNESRTRIKLIRNGELKDYELDRSSGRIQDKHRDGQQFASLGSLLASSTFANIRSLRETQRRLADSQTKQRIIDPEGVLVNAGHESELTLEAFRTALRASPQKGLAIILLDGPAGVGKTSLIARMVVERAAADATLPPLLHVASGGGKLTDLSRSLAYATQMLRTSITFDQVPVLVRHNLLQVAIDGFDELVDPEGYRDAWSALRDFLGEVGTGGPVLLSGRDTFFDQQSFEKRLADRIQELVVTSARLHPVSPKTAREFLLGSGWSSADVESAESMQWLRSGSYRLRPFFLAQIARAGGWTELVESHSSPQAFLVERFVQREADIIARMIGMPVELAVKALWEFYGLITEDMAANEMDAVDTGYLGLACQAAFREYLGDEDLAKLAHKAGSMGLLEVEGSSDSRRFPHSEIQNQFLARAIIQNLESSAAISSFLRRATVAMSLTEAFGDMYGILPPDRAKAVVSRLERLAADERFADRVPANVAALLLATLMRNSEDESTVLKEMATNEVRVFGTLRKARLESIQIARLDARGADCRDVEFIDCAIGILTVDETTVFGERRPTVSILQMEEQGRLKSTADQSAIVAWLDGQGDLSDKDWNEWRDLRLVRYFDKVCRKFIRQHQIRAHEQDEGYFLLRDPLWPEVESILGPWLQQTQRQSGGTSSWFYQLRRPDALLQPNDGDPGAIEIRRALVSRAKELEGIVD